MIQGPDPERLLQVLGIEAGVLAGVASDAPAGASVPHCPGLTLGETVRHVGALYRSTLAWITTGRKPVEWQREPKPEQSLLEFFRIGLRDVMTELTAHDPDEPCATWSESDRTYGFWCRRLAHETTVHRVDVQGAAAVPITPIDRDVALDGVDEVLRQWFVWKLRALGIRNTQNAAISLRCMGVEGGWLVNALRGEDTAAWWMPDLSHVRKGLGTVVARNPQALYLWLWGRKNPWGDTLPDGRRDLVFTGEDAIAQLWALLRLGTR